MIFFDPLIKLNFGISGIITEELTAFLEVNMPKSDKKNQIQLGVCDPKLGAAINEALGIKVNHTGVVPEVSLII